MTTIYIFLGSITIFFFFAFLSIRSGRKSKIIVSAIYEEDQKKRQAEIEQRLRESENEEFAERWWNRQEFLYESGYYDDKA